MIKLDRTLSWCTHLLIKRRNLMWQGYLRTIFSTTGIWDQKLSRDIRLDIERHWKPFLEEHDKNQSNLTSQEDTNKERYYALSMFPYPSGNLHLGHVRVYTISDVITRYQRSTGKVVIHPMGWDAFGLPAENAAIERGINPKDWTSSNIEKMKVQLQSLGFSFDWNREIATCDPDYYKWTQFIFLKMFEKGLAYQRKGLVNWDPVDMTVLADAQIDDNGCSWRSGALVEKRYLKQWYLRDTVFSQSLLEGLDEVDPKLWKDIISLQKNWISNCDGHRIDFNIILEDGSFDSPLSIYTTDLDLIYGVSHLFVSPSHYLCLDAGFDEDSVLPFQAIHPFTGEHLKIVVTSKNNLLEHKDVMLGIPSVCDLSSRVAQTLGFSYRVVLDESGSTVINSNELSGMIRKDALEAVIKKAKNLCVGGERISSKLNDWLISRQRYWGTPIPIIHCSECKAVPVPYENLPVTLPDTDRLVAKGGHSPLAENLEWLHVTCPSCGGPAKRETDTMDTFVDSTWYFLRYLDPHNHSMPFDPVKVNKFMPVDLYVGGKEHAVLHLYFARFVCHFLHSLGLLQHKEPFKNLLTQGMVKGESFRVKSSGKYIARNNVDFSGQLPVEKETAEEVLVDWEKMSKSKHNGVNPEEVLKEYGIDSTRLCILSNVSPQSERNWSNIVYKGVLNWQSRIWSLISQQRELAAGRLNPEKDVSFTQEKSKRWEIDINRTRNYTVKCVNYEFGTTFHINAAISRLHSFVTYLTKVPSEIVMWSPAYERALADLVVIICPMAPHFASELWAGLSDVAQFGCHQWKHSVHHQKWPSVDSDYLMPITYKVNGIEILKMRVPFSEFNSLDEERAFQLLNNDLSLKHTLSGLESTNCSFHKMEEYRAVLNLTIPEYKHSYEQDHSSSKKKKAKPSKKRRLQSADA